MSGEYLSVIISACMLVIAFITYNRGTRKMDGEQISNMAFLKNELEHIKSDLGDIKDSISEIKKRKQFNGSGAFRTKTTNKNFV